MDSDYLAGNVRAKLTVAEAAALADEQFRGNVEALRQVQPADLNATEIDGRLGSTWIPAEDVQKFAQEALGEEDITVSHAPQLGLWVVRGGYGVRFSVANTTECGTDRRSALELIEDALNLRVPTVYDHDPDTDRDVINGSATEAARDKQEKLKERSNAVRAGTPGFFNSTTTSARPLTKLTKSGRQVHSAPVTLNWLTSRKSVFADCSQSTTRNRSFLARRLRNELPARHE